ncbi:MAG TPA: hypothetical protein PK253_05985 [Spirochaetota bacterium]|nr:hypothetical protein [Spirochaetota bacterium]
MTQLFKMLYHVTHLDPRVYELEKEVEFHQYIIFAAVVVILLLVAIVFLQSRIIKGRKQGKTSKIAEKLYRPKQAAARTEAVSPAAPANTGKVTPKELPDPGLIFKYSLAKEDMNEKMITIGQTEGNVKTYSTEIIDNHLSIYIRIIENRQDRDIYDLPDKIIEEYQVDIRRDGKSLVYYPGLTGFREMGSRERLYVKKEPDVAGDPTFPSLEPKNPVRFRLGDRLNQDGKFVNGFFEFHFFTKDYEVQTKAGIPKIEKYFMLRLYKIYPGYDTGAPTGDGLYPMVDPFTTG